MPRPASLYPLEARDPDLSQQYPVPPPTLQGHMDRQENEKGSLPTPEWVPVPLGLMLRGDGHLQAITQIPCAVKRMRQGARGQAEGLPKVTCQPSQVMGQPVQRLWGRNEHVIKPQKGSERTSAE